jgi:hypothetical protein
MFFRMRTFLRTIILCLFLAVLTGCSSTNTTPLTKAAGEGDLDTVRILLEQGVDVDGKSFLVGNELTALHWAAYNGRTDIVRILLEAGADMNFKDVVGYTPLHYGAYYNYIGVVSLLVEAGAKPDVVSQFGTPLQIAQKKGYENVVNMLKKAEKQYYLNSDKSATLPVNKEAPIAFQTVPLAVTPDKAYSEALDFGYYHALVIGNNDYKYLPKLHTAINDAQSIAHLLQNSYGFTVKLLRNGTRADIIRTLNGYRHTLTKRDNFLIYYAGHGWLDKDADQGYWLPVNATQESQVEWISNNAITSEIRAIQAKHIIVVVDSCYSGKLARGLQITQKSSDYFARLSRKKARVVLSSGGLEPVMDQGGKGRHSIFASALIDSLNGNKGVLAGASLFIAIREQVGWNADQTPEYSNIHKAGHDGGDFLFVRRK